MEAAHNYDPEKKERKKKNFKKNTQKKTFTCLLDNLLEAIEVQVKKSNYNKQGK